MRERERETDDGRHRTATQVVKGWIELLSRQLGFKLKKGIKEKKRQAVI